MRVNQEIIHEAWALTVSASAEKWLYAEGYIKDTQGQVIAYLCPLGTTPTFQQEVNGEFIAAIYNYSRELLETISHLQGVTKKLGNESCA